MHRALALIVVLALAAVAWFLVDSGMLGDLVGSNTDHVTHTVSADFLTGENDGDADKPGVMLQGFGPAVSTSEKDAKLSSLEALLNAGESFAKGATGAKVPFRAYVVDVDGDPVAEVDITIDGTEHKSRTVTKSDEQGAFEVELPAGRYDLLFESESAGALAVRNYIVDGAKDQTKEFTLRDRATVRVFAKQGGKPLSGARVMVQRYRPKRIAAVKNAVSRPTVINGAGSGVEPEFPIGSPAARFTDASGKVTYEGLPIDRYEISISTSPSAGDEDPGGPTQSVTRWIKGTVDIYLNVPKSAKLKGSVRASKEGPRIPATLLLKTKARGTSGVLASTFSIEPNSDFEIDVPSGKVESISVVADGYASWPEPHKRKSIYRKLYALRRGKPARLDVILSKGRAITGKVLTQEGDPVSGVTLRFKGRYAEMAVEATSDKEGLYSVGELTADRYEMSIVNRGVYPIADQRSVVKLPRGQDKPFEFDVKVAPARTLRGRVLDADGEPQPAARVWIVGGGRSVRNARNIGRDLETFTDAKGRFALAELHPERSVFLRAAVGELQATPISIPARRAAPDPLQLVLEPAETIHGVVTDGHGHRVPGVRIRFRPMTGDGRTGKAAYTNTKGEFTTRNFIPGDWRAEVSKRRYLKTPHKVFRVHSGGGDTRLDLEINPGMIFSGRVRDIHSSMLQGVRVSARMMKKNGRPGRSMASGTTDNFGNFRLTGIKPTGAQFMLVFYKRGYKTVRLKNQRGPQDRIDVGMQRN